MSSYTAFDFTKPAGSQTGPNFAASANNNDVALCYAIASGNIPGWTFSITNGTGTTEEPQYHRWANGTQVVRATNTWSGGYITAQTWEVSQDTGSSYATVGSTTYTYDGSTGAPTAGTNAGGVWGFVLYAIGKVKSMVATLASHTSTLAGLGTLSTQNANAVAITGGSVSCTYEREAVATPLGTLTNGSNNLNWQSGGIVTATVGAGATATAFAYQNLPSGVVGYMTVELTNGGQGVIGTIFPSGSTKWPGGRSAWSLSAAGVDIITLMCRDGASVQVVGMSKGMAA